MTLANYIVNLEKLEQILTSAFAGTDEITSKVQKSKGVMLDSLYGTQSVTWTPDEGIGITGIRFGQEDIRNLGYTDYFNMYVDGELVMSNIYCKEVNEYKQFRSYYLVAEETDITFEYFNETGIQKEVKFDIDYIESAMPQKEFIILCRDMETNELIGKFSVFYTPIFEGVINPPNIPNYVPITPPISVSIKPYSPSPQTITFFYDHVPPPPPLPDPEIDHFYDWKFVLRWEGNVGTDIDFHASYDDEMIYYANRNDVILDDNDNPIEGIWLDIDYTSHKGGNDRQEKPEVITILGKPSGNIKLFARNYRGGEELREKVTLEVFKLQDDGRERLITTIEKEARLFHPSKADVDFLYVNPATGEITEL